MARRINIADVTVAAGGHAPVESAKISANKGVHQGTMVGYKMTISNCVNAINVVLKVKDQDGDVIYAGDAKAKGATYVVMEL